MLFYIIFGTNLLTGGRVPVSVFLPISVFSRKGISNGIQTEWNLREDLFWNKCNPGDLERTSRKEQGGHEVGRHAQGGRRAPTLVAPSYLHRRTSFAYLYSYTLKTSREFIVWTLTCELVATLTWKVLWERIDVMMLGKVMEIIIDQTCALSWHSHFIDFSFIIYLLEDE